MYPAPDPPPANPEHQLQRDIHLQVVHDLLALLPPPAIDTEEARDRRDSVALAQIAAMHPVNAYEADLAVHCVATSAHAKDCLRLAILHAADPKRAQQLHAQYESMLRQSRGYQWLLIRVRGIRLQRDAVETTCHEDAMTRHCVMGFLTDARQAIAPSPTAARLAPPPPPPPPPKPRPPEPAADPELQLDLAAEAERYAIIYPRRAAQIRKLGGLPDPCTFGPPEPELVAAIIAGTTPALRELDAQDHAPW